MNYKLLEIKIIDLFVMFKKSKKALWSVKERFYEKRAF